MLHIGGWYDSLLSGTLSCHAALEGQVQQALVIGPWVHIPWARQVGARDFGPEAESGIDALQVRWFDHWLKGADSWREPAVSLFELGGGWRPFDAWPVASQGWGLSSSGRAGMTGTDGVLHPGAGAGGIDVIVYDPTRPTPSLGGHVGEPAGPRERTEIDARSDVLVFTTPPLDRDLHLAGAVDAVVRATADAASFDLHAVLSELPAEGGVFELTSGYCRVSAADGPIAISLRAICACVRAGSRLRVSIAAGAFPAFPVNSGTGKAPGEERLIDQRVITVVVHHGAGSGTALHLPVCEGAVA